MTRVLEVIGKRPQGGIGAFITNYQSHFKGNDVCLDYLIFNDEPTGSFDQKVKAMGSNIYVLPELRNTRLFNIWKSINNFFHDNKGKYDAVHLHSVNIAFMIFPAARRNGIKYLLSHSHSTVYSDKKLNAFRNYFLCKGIKKQATHFLACSVAASDFLYGIENRESVLVFKNAIECSNYSFVTEIRNEYRKFFDFEDQLIIGHVGRFSETKNQKFLIEVFRDICDINDNAVLMLVGDGPLKIEIEKKVLNYGLSDKVLFLGQRDDVNKLMMAMDVFVLPSIYEGLPVVGVEAQASGLTCFMSDTITDEVEITNVEFMSINDGPKAWAERICNVKLNSDSHRREDSKAVAAKGYDINQEADNLYEFYRRLSM